VPAQPPQTVVTRAPRPVPVSIFALLAFAFAVLLTVLGVLTLIEAEGEREALVEGAVELGSAVLAFAVCVGAMRVKRWAWVVFMSWAVVGLTLQLLRVFFFDDPVHWRLAFITVAVFLLTPLDMQIAFGVRKPPHARS
jgi:hypothetical protein